MLNRPPAGAAFVPAADAGHAVQVRRKGFVTGHADTGPGKAPKPAPESSAPRRIAGPMRVIPAR